MTDPRQFCTYEYIYGKRKVNICNKLCKTGHDMCYDHRQQMNKLRSKVNNKLPTISGESENDHDKFPKYSEDKKHIKPEFQMLQLKILHKSSDTETTSTYSSESSFE